MTLLTTGEVYKITGLTERSIRYYSNLNLLKANKNDNGQ
ncbi:MerR family DNA-binding transcriptional regulator [Priestia flexa]